MSSQYTLLMRSLNTQPHQAAVVRVQPVYISDEEPLHVQPNQPAATTQKKQKGLQEKI